MINNLAVGLLLSKHDLNLLKPWVRRHDSIGAHIIIGLDELTSADIPDFVYNCKSRISLIDTPLNNDFAAARNKIINKSKELFCEATLFLDADELLLPNTDNGIDLEHPVNFVLNHFHTQYAAFQRYNIFSRTLVDFPNYHACLVDNKTVYANNSHGCHEIPLGNPVWFSEIKILHLKEVWESNFRGKGYHDIRQEEALNDLRNKINEIK